MRGRKPRALPIRPADLAELERIAHSDSSPWYQVRRARIVLGIGKGQPREHLAYRLDCAQSTIWRTCQLYRACGLDGVLSDGRLGHSGRDLGFTPVKSRDELYER